MQKQIYILEKSMVYTVRVQEKAQRILERCAFKDDNREKKTI